MLKRIAVVLAVAALALLGSVSSAQAIPPLSAREPHFGCDVRSSNGTIGERPYWIGWNASAHSSYVGSFRLSDACGSLNITVHGFRYHPNSSSDVRLSYVNSDNDWVVGSWNTGNAPGHSLRLLVIGLAHPVNQRFAIDVRDHNPALRAEPSWAWVDISF